MNSESNMYTLLPRNDRFLQKDDISVDPDELLSYRDWIRSHDNLLAKIAEEFHHVCQYDFINRCSVLCDILQEDGNTHISKHPLVEEGKTLLHLACFSNSTDVGCHLVATFGRDLVPRAIPSGMYGGATPIHIACLQGNVKLLECMMEILTRDQCKALLNSEAHGSFFRDKLMVGGFPINLAIWGCHKDLCKQLIIGGAQLDLQDERKDQTPVHGVVLQGLYFPELAVDMMEWILSPTGGYLWWSLKKDLPQGTSSKYQIKEFHHYILKIRDKEGLTALGLAGKLGVPNIIKLIIRVEGVYCHTVWTTPRASHIYYDMREIDPAVNPGPSKSLLEYIIYMCNSKTLSMLTEEPFNSLISKKWQSYKYILFVSMVLHLIIMLIFTTSILMEGDGASFHYQNIRLCGTYIVAFAAFIYLIFEVLDITNSIRDWIRIRRLPLKLITKLDAFRPITWIFSTQILLAALSRTLDSQKEDIFQLISGVAGWYMLLGFTRVFRSTAFFTNAIHQVLTKDIPRFCMVTGTLIIGFSLGLPLLMQSIDDSNGTVNFEDSLLDLFALTIGLADLNIPRNSRWPTITTLFIVLFILLASFLMISLLIASVNDTYREISNNQNALWKRNSLLCILMTERRLYRPCMSLIRPKYLQYNTKLCTWLLSVEHVENHN